MVNPSIKTFIDKGIEFNVPIKSQHRIDVDKSHPNMAKEEDNPYSLMTDDEFEQFKEHQKKVLMKGLPLNNELGEKRIDGLEQILKNRYIVESKNRYGQVVGRKYVTGKDLPKDELEEKVKALKEQATKYANIKMGLKKKADITTEVKKEGE